MLWSNRSATKTSLRDYKGALEDADKVGLSREGGHMRECLRLCQCIELDPSFVKGHARKGAALHGLGELEEAVFA